MAVEKIAFKGNEVTIQNKKSASTNLTGNTPVDEEKSSATKYMIGATALAGVIALGVAGYKGHLGKGIQKFLGGAEKAGSKTDVPPVPKKPTAPEAVPEGKMPEPKAPETPEVKASDAPEVKVPEGKMPEASAPETKVPDAPKAETPEVKPVAPKEELFTPEALKGIEGERQGNKIIQTLEDGKQRIYEFESGNNAFSVHEGRTTTTYNADGKTVSSIVEYSSKGKVQVQSTFEYDDLGRQSKINEYDGYGRSLSKTENIYDGTSTRLMQRNINDSDYSKVIEYNLTTGKPLKITVTDKKFGHVTVQKHHKTKGYPLSETCYDADGKNVRYMTTFQQIKQPVCRLSLDGNVVDTNTIRKGYVEFYSGTKNKSVEIAYDTNERRSLYREYAKDGKTVLFEEIYKDGEVVSHKGDIMARYKQ